MEKNKPERDGKLIPGSTENSDFCAPVPFVNSKLKSILLARQKAEDLHKWEPSNLSHALTLHLVHMSYPQLHIAHHVIPLSYYTSYYISYYSSQYISSHFSVHPPSHKYHDHLTFIS